MKTILVTGGAGFIGSNFIRLLFKMNEFRIINYDKLTYASDLSNLDGIFESDKYRFIKGCITDYKLLDEVFAQENIDYVVNFAAESHVDRSIEAPDVFIKTNVLGTQVLLDTVRKHWMSGVDEEGYPKYREGVKYLQISTDEVYGALGESGYFTEKTPLAPNSPYAASKASADLLVRAYFKTYKLPMNITRCSNNYGPRQHEEKLIPMIIRKCIHKKAIPVYGDGKQVRDWIHVEDHCQAVLEVLNLGTAGEVYNIGGHNEICNLDVVMMILNRMDCSPNLIEFVSDRLGHDRRYAIDNNKIIKNFGWEPKVSFSEGLNQSIEWYCSKFQSDGIGLK